MSPTQTITATMGDVRRTVPASTERSAAHFREVAKAVRDAGLLERATGFYLWLLGGLAALTAATIATGVLLGASWFLLIVAGVLGVLLAQFAFVAHEASHRQVLRSGPANDRLGRFLAAGVVGISHQWWMTKHSRHHANPNQIGRDPDIEVDTVSFLESDAAEARGLRRWITKRQGWLFFPLLTLEGLNLHVLSIRTLFARGKVEGRAIELALIAVRIALVVGLVFWLLPAGMAFAFLGVQLAVFGIVMGASFAPNHKGMPIVGREERLDFFTKQVRTSRNIRGAWTSWLMGGLNFQIEHHLFPNMARPHLRAAAAIVRAHCRTHGIPYVETGLVESYGIVVRYLNRVGLAARDPFECPMLQQRQVPTGA